jgi:hypothetical protein
VPVQEPQNLCQRCVVPKLRRHMSTLLTDCPPSASPLIFPSVSRVSHSAFSLLAAAVFLPCRSNHPGEPESH